MPLPLEVRELVSTHCARDLPGDLTWHVDEFSFIDDDDLRRRLGRAYYTARYVGKVLEALHPNDGSEHAFVKFQVIQYASIYEAVITKLLWTCFKEHPRLKQLETHRALKKVSAFAQKTSMDYDGETVYPAVYRDAKTNRNSIPFAGKVDCAVDIGFIDSVYAADIKNIYYLRNPHRKRGGEANRA